MCSSRAYECLSVEYDGSDRYLSPACAKWIEKKRKTKRISSRRKNGALLYCFPSQCSPRRQLKRKVNAQRRSARRFASAENVDEIEAELHTCAYVCYVYSVGKFVSLFFLLILWTSSRFSYLPSSSLTVFVESAFSLYVIALQIFMVNCLNWLILAALHDHISKWISPLFLSQFPFPSAIAHTQIRN